MRIYHALLHLYPASFRAEYGEEMAAIFRARLRDAGGAAARLTVWLAILPEIVVNALAVHWDILKQDLRYAARTLRRAPGFAVTAIVIVALGVGANTAAFSVTDFVLFRPLPFPDADRLVTIWQRSPGYSRMELSPANIRDWKQAATSFERVGIHRQMGANLIGSGEPERIVGAAISADLFPTLGVRAALGRIFADGEDSRRRAEHGHPERPALAHARSAATRTFSGRKVVLDDQTYSVIGVMPPGFSFPRREVELWVPLVLSPDDYQDRTNNELYAVARLKPGATLDSARSEMDVIAAQSRKQYPKENENTSATVNGLRGRTGQPVPGHGAGAQRRSPVRAAHRLRQPREPPARTGARPPAGAGRPDRDGRGTRAPDPAARHGKRRPRCPWRCARHLPGGGDRSAALAAGAGRAADGRHSRHRSAGAGICGGADARDRARVRPRADS